MERRTKIVVLGAVENEKGEILLTRRFDPKVPDAHLMWDLPGGTVEFGEHPHETVVREVEEEVSLVVTESELMPLVGSHVWNHVEYELHVLLLCYRCAFHSGEARASDSKIAEVRWVSKRNLTLLTFLPTTKQFIDYLLTK